jgi:urate oxidase
VSAPNRVTIVRDNYGKQDVRLVKVVRHPDRHDLTDLTVDVRFEGDYATVHTAGDNSKCLPTDTMKNTVYAMARQHPVDQVEEFGVLLANHFLSASRAVSRVTVTLAEHLWSRLVANGRPHHHAFVRASEERRVATVTATRDWMSVEGGVENLVVLKTTGSAFEGYVRDRYTTLAETSDRILATAVSAHWRYAGSEIPFRLVREQLRQLILETFAEHDSRSVQHTLYAMAEAGLTQCGDIVEMRISLPNRHHLLVDLSPFGLDNPNQIFVPTTEPHGLIEAVVKRG